MNNPTIILSSRPKLTEQDSGNSIYYDAMPFFSSKSKGPETAFGSKTKKRNSLRKKFGPAGGKATEPEVPQVDDKYVNDGTHNDDKPVNGAVSQEVERRPTVANPAIAPETEPFLERKTDEPDELGLKDALYDDGRAPAASEFGDGNAVTAPTTPAVEKQPNGGLENDRSVVNSSKNQSLASLPVEEPVAKPTSPPGSNTPSRITSPAPILKHTNYVPPPQTQTQIDTEDEFVGEKFSLHDPANGANFTRAASVHSLTPSLARSQRSMGPGHIQPHHDRDPSLALARASSVRSRRTAASILSSAPTGTRDGGSTFIHGAGTTGPLAEPELDPSVHERARTAEAQLTPKQRSKIVKQERKEGGALSKVIRSESKVEQRGYQVAIRELGDLQKMQKSAVVREAAAHKLHSKAQTQLSKKEQILLAAQVEYDTASAKASALEGALERGREYAREVTDNLSDKMREVERLRALKGTDERERGVKYGELTGKGGGSKWNCFGGGGAA